MEAGRQEQNTHFDLKTYDTYEWYLDLGPLSNIIGSIFTAPFLTGTPSVEHPDYEEFWKKESWVSQLHGLHRPQSECCRFWDQEEPWGPWQIFRHAKRTIRRHTNLWLPVPGFTGQWFRGKGEHHWHHFRSPDTRLRGNFRGISKHLFPLLSPRQGREAAWQASTFQSGSNTWHTYAFGPPKERSLQTCICTQTELYRLTAPNRAKPG